MSNNFSGNLGLGTYLGTATGGNVKVYRKYNEDGEGVYLKCNKCAGVLLLNKESPADYTLKGILEQEVQDYVKLHKHLVAQQNTSWSTSIGQYGNVYSNNWKYYGKTLPISNPTVYVPVEKPSLPEPVKKVGRKFR